MDIREHLRTRPLLFDGAMGTFYAAQSREPNRACELANLSDPGLVEEIHRAYRAAGCDALKTNTFGANRANLGDDCEAVIRAGWQLAVRAAQGAYVFADIGPVDAENPAEEYRELCALFLNLGAEHFLFETQSRLDGLPQAAAYIKERNPRAFVMLSFGAQSDGFTRAGERADALLRAAAANPHVDAAGLNCVCGASHMARLLAGMDGGRCVLSAMPNAGYPTVRGHRVFYDGNPGYFAGQLGRLLDQGARILGGCCGTTPAYIAAAAKMLRDRRAGDATQAARPDAARLPGKPPAQAESRSVGTAPAPAGQTAAQTPGMRPGEALSRAPRGEAESAFFEALRDPNLRPVAVELDPPANADVSRFMAGARVLVRAGAGLITVADCPVARARMDASLLACRVRRELGAEVMPHMTCRDRNLNATQALLLGLCAEGVGSVLAVTGNPIPSAGRDEVKSVYNFNSRRLIRYIVSLGETMLPRPFHVYAALNVNARNFDVQLNLAREKEAAGACGFFTQPVLTARALDNLRRARQTLRAPLVGGVLPVVSHRNALFLRAEMPGIELDERVAALYEGADRAAGEEIAVRVSRAAAARMAPHVDGFYLMTPFGRAGLVARVMDAMRVDGLI